jgi:hypothetical protein
MARRPSTRRALNLETLESRQLLTAGVAPTAEKQYMLELVNLVRTKPAEAAQRLRDKINPSTKDTLDYYGVNLDAVSRDIAGRATRQPLAWNDALGNAAEGQSRDMADNAFQSHTGSDGSTPDVRMSRAGYKDATKSAENAFAYSESVDQAMQAFAYDWGVADRGHLRNLTEPGDDAENTFKEIGIGIVNSNKPGFGKVITQDFGRRADGPSYLLGVAYKDDNQDRFYTPGEGRGGVEVDVTDDQGQTQTTFSGEAGGYQIPLNPGHYRVTAKVGGRAIRSQDINLGAQNVKLDFILSDAATETPEPVSTPTPRAQNNAKPVVSTVKPTQPVLQQPEPKHDDTPVSTPPDAGKVEVKAAPSSKGQAAEYTFLDSLFGYSWQAVFTDVPQK